MLRTAMMMFALSSLATGCLDDDPPEGGEVSGDNEPDVQDPNENADDLPANCHQLDGDADNPVCKSKS
jgi:hypothetical protein